VADTTEDAWSKGYNAGANREPETSNPYIGKLGQEWLEGWREGGDPDREERERDS
jgi:ribosome modulation factor